MTRKLRVQTWNVCMGSKDVEMTLDRTWESTGDLGWCKSGSYGDYDDTDKHEGDKKARCDPF